MVILHHGEVHLLLVIEVACVARIEKLVGHHGTDEWAVFGEAHEEKRCAGFGLDEGLLSLHRFPVGEPSGIQPWTESSALKRVDIRYTETRKVRESGWREFRRLVEGGGKRAPLLAIIENLLVLDRSALRVESLAGEPRSQCWSAIRSEVAPLQRFVTLHHELPQFPIEVLLGDLASEFEGEIFFTE